MSDQNSGQNAKGKSSSPYVPKVKTLYEQKKSKYSSIPGYAAIRITYIKDVPLIEVGTIKDANLPLSPDNIQWMGEDKAVFAIPEPKKVDLEGRANSRLSDLDISLEEFIKLGFKEKKLKTSNKNWKTFTYKNRVKLGIKKDNDDEKSQNWWDGPYNGYRISCSKLAKEAIKRYRLRSKDNNLTPNKTFVLRYGVSYMKLRRKQATLSSFYQRLVLLIRLDYILSRKVPLVYSHKRYFARPRRNNLGCALRQAAKRLINHPFMVT